VSGRVYLVPQAWGGFAGTEHTIGDWVTRVLLREADVAAKLAAHPDVAERHAFIWATRARPETQQAKSMRTCITAATCRPRLRR
jgi:hypothetical protein